MLPEANTTVDDVDGKHCDLPHRTKDDALAARTRFLEDLQTLRRKYGIASVLVAVSYRALDESAETVTASSAMFMGNSDHARRLIDVSMDAAAEIITARDERVMKRVLGAIRHGVAKAQAQAVAESN